MVHVAKYQRADGTKVRAHSRWAAGARQEMTILAVVALVIVGAGSTTSSGSGNSGDSGDPAPRQTAGYPVRFPDQEKPKRPSLTVSYPIRFDTH
ncbi:hypothetical protein [Streptomyces longisporoflavus]|uniref:Uncharacterized protein n=1 Tax=Streptomyces longisporoflavus TaxID=28044 RepID=A0ABW7R5E1_9ACTN